MNYYYYSIRQSIDDDVIHKHTHTHMHMIE